jgi:hypothetical protein
MPEVKGKLVNNAKRVTECTHGATILARLLVSGKLSPKSQDMRKKCTGHNILVWIQLLSETLFETSPPPPINTVTIEMRPDRHVKYLYLLSDVRQN